MLPSQKKDCIFQILLQLSTAYVMLTRRLGSSEDALLMTEMQVWLLELEDPNWIVG